MRPIVALPAVAVALIAGCGSSSSSKSTSAASKPASPAPAATSPSAAPAASGVSVVETEYKLNPASATVASGPRTVTIKNAGAIPHALSIEKAGPGGADVKSATIAPGSSGTLAVKLKPGHYELYCPIDGHKGLGMKGVITVAASGASASNTKTNSGTSTGSGAGASKPTY